jgi:hypothetical protein
MSRMFSMTARVCSPMSSVIVPITSMEAPAMLLSERRELVPDTNRKSPARRTCGNLPRREALSATTSGSATARPTSSNLERRMLHLPPT